MFALAPPNRDACLRCRLRQTIHYLQRSRLPQSSHAAAAAAALPSAKHGRNIGSYRHFSIHAVQQYNVSRELTQDRGYKRPSADDLYDDQPEDKPLRSVVIPSSSDPVPKLPLRAQRRTRKASDYRLKNFPIPTHIPLKDVDLFGDPTSITRLANPERKDPKAADTEEEESVVPEYNEADVLEILEQDSSEPSPKEIIEAIDAIRDRWLANLDPRSGPTSRDCIRIYTQLLESFNSDQLHRYLKATQREDADEFDDLLGVFASEKCTRSKWHVGHTPLLSTSTKRLLAIVPSRPGSNLSQALMQESFEGKETATTSKKSGYATSIIRNSWRIIAVEESNKSGELDVLILPDIHHFLQTRFDLFRQIEQQCNVKTEYNEDIKVLRIRGSIENCCQAFTALYAPLCILRTKRIQLDHGVKAKRAGVSQLQGNGSVLALSVLENVGIFTKSHISRVIDKGGVLTGFDVTFLGPQLTESTVDTTTFDRVHRLIDDIAGDQFNRLDIHFLSDPILHHYQAPVQCETALPLQHRSTHLYRLRSECAGSNGTGLECPNVQRNLQAGIETGSKILPSWRWTGSWDNHRNDTQDHQWSTAITPSVTVSTGQIGFDRPEMNWLPFQEMGGKSKKGFEGLREKENEFKFETIKDKHKLFVPSLPGGISTFDGLNETEAIGEQRIVLTLKASAIIEQGSEVPDEVADDLALPDLQIELEPSEDENGALVAKGAKLIGAAQSTQIALPSEEFDLQIASTPFLANLQDPVVDQNTKNFIDQIALHNGRVDERSVPLSLEVSIPEMVLGINGIRASNKKRKSKPTSNMTVSRARTSGSEVSASNSQNHHTLLAGVDLQCQKQQGQLQRTTPKGCILVNYQFSRLEHHSRLRGRFQGYPLIYSMVDASGTGRQWEQLTLEARPAANVATDLSDLPMPDRTTPSGLDRLDQPVVEVGAGSKTVPTLVENAMKALTAAAEKEVEDKHTQGAKAEEVGEKAADRIRAEYKHKLERNPNLAWFLDFFQAALDMARKS